MWMPFNRSEMHFGVILALIALAAWALLVKQRRLFHRRLAALLAQLGLEAEQALGRLDGSDGPVQSLEDVPLCVRGYLTHAVRDSKRVKLLTIKQQLHLRFNPGGPWKPSPGTLCISPLLPVFSFRCRATMAPGIWVEGTECLVGGQGLMEWRLWGAIPVARMSGGLLDKAARVRWLAEAVACPAALLPSAVLRWEAVEGRADQGRAVVEDRGVTVAAVYTFDERHNVVGIRSEDYARAEGGAPAPCGIVGRCWDHGVLSMEGGGEVVVPRHSEASFVGQHGPEGEPYVRVQLESMYCETISR